MPVDTAKILSGLSRVTQPFGRLPGDWGIVGATVAAAIGLGADLAKQSGNPHLVIQRIRDERPAVERAIAAADEYRRGLSSGG